MTLEGTNLRSVPGYNAIMSNVAATPAVRISQLVKKFRGASDLALNGLDLCITEGEFFGLLGPNGSGKTTTISIACGLLRPTAGEVRVCGLPVRHNPTQVKRQIGLVPQDVALYGQLTLEENLRYFGAMHGLHGTRLRERISACLGTAQLERFADRRVATFSGGMRRRANIAVGIVHRPRVLFLDEPTVGVDPQSRNVIFENLQELHESGITLIYTTHYMEEAQQLCSRLAIMDRGAVVSEGTSEELIGRTPGCRTLGDVFLSKTGKQLRE